MNIFLVPAKRENLEASIINSVDVNDLKEFLSADFILELKSKSGIEGIKCWAMTKTNLNYFREISEGDIVLFSETGTGKFNFSGKIIGKTRNMQLGNKLWPFNREKPWECIYFLKDIRKINIDKQELVVDLGYKANYAVPGTLMLRGDKKEIFISEYGKMNDYFSKRNDQIENEEVKEIGSNYSAKDIDSKGSYRQGHNSWAKKIKQSYEWKCAICRIEKEDFLRAGHISAWSEDKKNRLNPKNGICLCVLHDIAFEKGYISLSDNYEVILNPHINKRSNIGKKLKSFKGEKIDLPKENLPDLKFIKNHRKQFGFE